VRWTALRPSTGTGACSKIHLLDGQPPSLPAVADRLRPRTYPELGSSSSSRIIAVLKNDSLLRRLCQSNRDQNAIYAVYGLVVGGGARIRPPSSSSLSSTTGPAVLQGPLRRGHPLAQPKPTSKAAAGERSQKSRSNPRTERKAAPLQGQHRQRRHRPGGYPSRGRPSRGRQ
jgi:hypothetical protein